MFGVQSNLNSRRRRDYNPANWEADIRDVSVEACDAHEDPLGFRVVFYKRVENENVDAAGYRIGASYLKNRLRKLTRAGFDAPMTKKAINIVKEKRLKFT